MTKHKTTIDIFYDGKILNRHILDEIGQIDVISKAFNIGKVFYLYQKKYFFWFRFLMDMEFGVEVKKQRHLNFTLNDMATLNT